MNIVDKLNEMYLKYGNDVSACVKEYNEVHTCNKVKRKIKKIAIYNTVLRFGGIGRVISHMLPLYKKMNYDVILITEEMSENDYDISASISRYSITSALDISRGRETFKTRMEQLYRVLADEDVDLFIHHGTYEPLFAYDIMLANLCGTYSVAERHQVFSEEFCRFKDLFPVQIETFKLVDKLVVLSNMDVLYWSSLGVDAVYIENPFNEQLVNISRMSDEENIIWVGRLELNQKQYLDVLQIAQIVTNERANAKFFMYGYGSDTDVERLNTAILKAKLSRQVIYCGFENDLNKIYQNARIHLVTSAYEAFPMGIYESRICGIPLVMYELPYLELLRDKKGYLSVDNGNIKGMAGNICKILSNKDLEDKLQAEAKESVKKFNNDIICAKWKKMFDNIEQENKVGPVEQEMGSIIRIMHKHFAIAQKKYMDLIEQYEQEKIIFNATKGMKLGRGIVICPYGSVGKKVKQILNEHGIYEKFIMDNNLSKGNESVKSFDEIKEMDCKALFFIISTKQKEIKQLFYEKLLEISPQDSIVYYDEINA